MALAKIPDAAKATSGGVILITKTSSNVDCFKIHNSWWGNFDCLGTVTMLPIWSHGHSESNKFASAAALCSCGKCKPQPELTDLGPPAKTMAEINFFKHLLQLLDFAPYLTALPVIWFLLPSRGARYLLYCSNWSWRVAMQGQLTDMESGLHKLTWLSTLSSFPEATAKFGPTWWSSSSEALVQLAAIDEAIDLWPFWCLTVSLTAWVVLLSHGTVIRCGSILLPALPLLQCQWSMISCNHGLSLAHIPQPVSCVLCAQTGAQGLVFFAVGFPSLVLLMETLFQCSSSFLSWMKLAGLIWASLLMITCPWAVLSCVCPDSNQIILGWLW